MKITNKRQFIDYINQAHIKHNLIFPNISSILLHMFTVLGNGFDIVSGNIITHEKMTKKTNNHIKTTVNKILADNQNIKTYDFVQIISDDTKYPDLSATLQDYGYIFNFERLKHIYTDEEWEANKERIYNKRQVMPFDTFTEADIDENLSDRLLQEMIDTKDSIYPMPSNYFIFKDCNNATPKWLVKIGLYTIVAVLNYIETDVFASNRDNLYYPKEFYVTEFKAMYNTLINLMSTYP